jgi:uncharacterized surface protein with fasciclin (FAS1) repeats
MAAVPQAEGNFFGDRVAQLARTLFPSTEDRPDIVETAIGAGSFDILVAALEAADLVDALKGPGPFTVFAPTDDAFKKLPPELLRDLLEPENKAILTDILTFHVVGRDLMAADVIKLQGAKTLNGQFVGFQSRNNIVKVENARVILPDVLASNGVIHAIDTVLIPQMDAGKDLVETAFEAGRFNTLITALRAANLVETLKTEGPFTVFAPTDAAFAKIPNRTLKYLLDPQNVGQLTSILTYHVVPRKVMASDVVKLKSLQTLNGKSFRITIRDGDVYVGNAKIIRTDITASNGIIHVLDTVLLP